MRRSAASPCSRRSAGRSSASGPAPWLPSPRPTATRCACASSARRRPPRPTLEGREMIKDPHEIVLSSHDAAALYGLLRARSHSRALWAEELERVLTDARVYAPEHVPPD